MIDSFAVRCHSRPSNGDVCSNWEGKGGGGAAGWARDDVRQEGGGGEQGGPRCFWTLVCSATSLSRPKPDPGDSHPS